MTKRPSFLAILAWFVLAASGLLGAAPAGASLGHDEARAPSPALAVTIPLQTPLDPLARGATRDSCF